jgi:hypothetical protein
MNPEIRRGEEAKRVLAEPLLAEAFEAIEATLIDAMRRVDVGAKDRHQDLIVSLQLLGKVRGYLTDIVQTGKMAAMTEERETLLEKAKRRFRAV